jgi:hypothetical protein
MSQDQMNPKPARIIEGLEISRLFDRLDFLVSHIPATTTTRKIRMNETTNSSGTPTLPPNMSEIIHGVLRQAGFEGSSLSSR